MTTGSRCSRCERLGSAPGVCPCPGTASDRRARRQYPWTAPPADRVPRRVAVTLAAFGGTLCAPVRNSSATAPRLSSTPAALVAALSFAACGSTVAGTASDASPAADTVDAAVADVADVAPDAPDVAPADARPAACAWRVGAARDLAPPSVDAACALDDLVSPGGVAWLLRSCAPGGGTSAPASLVVDRVAADGSATAPVVVRTGVARSAEVTPSLAVSDALDRRGVLVPESPSGPATLVRLGRDAAVLGTSSLGTPPMSFSLGGFRRLMVNRAGYTAVAEQIRALWGVSMLQTDAAGAVMSAIDLDAPKAPPGRFDRAPLPDGTFVLTWAGMPPRDTTLLVRRHREDGTAFTRSPFVLGPTLTPAAGRCVVAPSDDGLLIAWETARGLAVQPLTSIASPTADARALAAPAVYGGGLDATAARGDVLVTAVDAAGAPRLVVLVLGPDGAPRGGPLDVAAVTGVDRALATARVVATPLGALVAFQRDARTVAVAPLTCEAP